MKREKQSHVLDPSAAKGWSLCRKSVQITHHEENTELQMPDSLTYCSHLKLVLHEICLWKSSFATLKQMCFILAFGFNTSRALYSRPLNAPLKMMKGVFQWVYVHVRPASGFSNEPSALKRWLTLRSETLQSVRLGSVQMQLQLKSV